MKIRSLMVAVAALSLSTLAFTAGDAFAAKIVPIQGKYSKIKLDGICAANGGSSYGSAEGSYGCSKGNVSVECQKDGSCKGFIFMQSSQRNPIAGDPASILQQSEAPAKPGVTSGGVGGALSAQ